MKVMSKYIMEVRRSHPDYYINWKVEKIVSRNSGMILATRLVIRAISRGGMLTRYVVELDGSNPNPKLNLTHPPKSIFE